MNDAMIGGHAVDDSGGLVDDPTRERIRHTALDETLFVQAGAGSGKTTLLVERIVNLVLTAGASLSTVAAITFTEAAAAELQSRIRAAFERAETQAISDGDTDRAERCRQAIEDTDLAAITTLHGFANRILGEFAVAADLPPRVRVLDEVSSQLAHEDRWARFVDRLYDDDTHEKLLVLASVLDIPVEPRYAEQITMQAVAVEFNQNWDRLEPLINRDLGALVEPCFDLFDHAVDDLAASLGDCKDPSDKLFIRLGEILPEMVAIQQISDPMRKVRLLANGPSWGPGNGGRAASWTDKDYVKGLIKAVTQAKDQVLEPVIDDVLTRLAQLIAVDTVAAAVDRRADGGLEFHDLLVLARNMLRTDSQARRTLHDRFRFVLLDEFQDTDPIQVELATLIATHADDVGGAGWQELPVEPGRLFFVGDPKQSIYRFRRADISLFLQAQESFAGETGPEQLRTNFRTVGPIVDWVNTMFDQAMGAGVENAQPAYEPLAAFREPADPRDLDLHRPVLLGGPHPDPKIRAADLRTVEADDVAGVVRAIVADPHAWPVKDQVSGEWRPAQLDDITILLPTRTSLQFLRAALDEADLQYRIVTGTLVYDTQEVVDALAALRAIDDPTNELSLVAALRSPLYGCSDVELLQWRRAGGRWDFRAKEPVELGDGHRVTQACRHLHGLWQQRWFLTPSALLERLLRERRAPLLAFGDTRPTDVWRRLRFLVEQARSFEEAGSGDLRAFTDWAALQGGSMARVHEPLLPETDEQALSIQTIHGAKGLEFPITILSGMTTQLRGGRSGVSVFWPSVGEPSVRMRKGIETRNHEPRADLEAAMDDFEKLRLAYVATTRARDHLIVSCHHKQGKGASKTYGGQFWTTFDTDERRGLGRPFDWREVVGRLEPDVPVAAQLGLALDDRQAWHDERRALLAPFDEPLVMSATGVATIANAGETPAIADQDDDGADQPEGDAVIPRRRGRTGSAIGSAVHGVLQALDLAAPDGIDDLVAQQCQLNAIGDRTIIVGRLVRAALGSAAVAQAAAHRHHKELFVAAPVQGRVIEGYVDLLIEGPDGLIVVDYKTDSVSTDADVDAKMAIYELQAAAYAVALQIVTGEPVVECRFVFCRSAGAIERSVADLDQAKQRVLDTLTSPV